MATHSPGRASVSLRPLSCHAGTKDRRNLRKIDTDRKLRGKRRRSDHIFSETAITAIAGVMLVLAHGLPTGLAIFAAHAGIVQPRNADGVAWLEIRDARAKRSYNACNLVAWNEGKRRLHRPIAFSGMQVGMADAAGHHLDQDLSRTRHRHGYVLYHQRLAELVHYGSLQDIAISQHALDLVRSKGKLPARYGNFIGGNWVAPADGQYFTDYSPINGERLIDVAKSTARDVEMALDAAHKAKDDWTRMAPAERSRLLNKVADRMEENLELLALAETLDNGKPIRETRGADVPLAIDHFRYFAGCIPAETGAISTIDNDAIAYHFREPLGVVGQIIPWNFPLLMAAWKIAPALAAGNCTVIKPASNTPLTLLILAGLTADILPPACST
jgi:hypothetical protein